MAAFLKMGRAGTQRTMACHLLLKKCTLDAELTNTGTELMKQLDNINKIIQYIVLYNVIIISI